MQRRRSKRVSKQKQHHQLLFACLVVLDLGGEGVLLMAGNGSIFDTARPLLHLCLVPTSSDLCLSRLYNRQSTDHFLSNQNKGRQTVCVCRVLFVWCRAVVLAYRAPQRCSLLTERIERIEFPTQRSCSLVKQAEQRGRGLEDSTVNVCWPLFLVGAGKETSIVSSQSLVVVVVLRLLRSETRLN